MKKQIKINHPRRAADGSITFAGVICEALHRYDSQGRDIGLAAGWNSETTERYIALYNNCIIPQLGQGKPMASFTKEDYAAALQRIDRKRLLSAKVNYAEATMDVFERLIVIVHRYALAHGYTKHDLWMTADEEKETKHETVAGTAIKRSLTISEEKAVANALFDSPENLTGEQVGLAIMLIAGLRNNECAALTFADCREIPAYPDKYELVIKASTVLRGKNVKAGGKTVNAIRYVPIPDILSNLILRRKTMLEGIGLPEGVPVSGLRIVCKGKQYTQPSGADDLTKAGRKMLREAGVSAEALSAMERETRRADAEEGIIEKSPTTYLLRRNAATHYYCLGLSDDEIRYLMGHAVESNATRAYLSSLDGRAELSEKIRHHPLNANHAPSNLLSRARGVQSASEKVFAGKTTIIVSTREPESRVKISVKPANGTDMEVKTTVKPLQEPYRDTVDNWEKITQKYQKEESQGGRSS